MALLHVSCPGNCTWALLQQLHQTVRANGGSPPQACALYRSASDAACARRATHAQGSLAVAVAHPHALLLDAGPLTARELPLLKPAYQHLYQELGYTGHLHHLPRHGSGSSGPAEAAAAAGPGALAGAQGCVPCQAGEDDARLPALRLGFVHAGGSVAA